MTKDQEPVAEIVKITGKLQNIHIIRWLNDYSPSKGDKLYTAPQSRHLSDSTIMDIWHKTQPQYESVLAFARAVLEKANG